MSRRIHGSIRLNLFPEGAINLSFGASSVNDPPNGGFTWQMERYGFCDCSEGKYISMFASLILYDSESWTPNLETVCMTACFIFCCNSTKPPKVKKSRETVKKVSSILWLAGMMCPLPWSAILIIIYIAWDLFCCWFIVMGNCLSPACKGSTISFP